MAKVSKRRAAIIEQLGDRQVLPLGEALDLVKNTATAKFDESVDMSLNLGIDARKSDQVVRGSAVLPHGLGKTVRIAVFAQGEAADKATEVNQRQVINMTMYDKDGRSMNIHLTAHLINEIDIEDG